MTKEQVPAAKKDHIINGFAHLRKFRCKNWNKNIFFSGLLFFRSFFFLFRRKRDTMHIQMNEKFTFFAVNVVVDSSIFLAYDKSDPICSSPFL